MVKLGLHVAERKEKLDDKDIVVVFLACTGKTKPPTQTQDPTRILRSISEKGCDIYASVWDTLLTYLFSPTAPDLFDQREVVSDHFTEIPWCF